MHKTFLLLGASLAGLAVALGAFGAHGLKKIVAADTVATFQTGVQYQMYHALALILLGILYERFAYSTTVWAGWSFVFGVLLFSGSLYLLTAFKAKGVVGLSGIGIITPFGGLLFILGWALLVASLLKK